MTTEITDLKRKVKELEEGKGYRRTQPVVRPEHIAEWADQLTLAQVTYWVRSAYCTSVLVPSSQHISLQIIFTGFSISTLVNRN